MDISSDSGSSSGFKIKWIPNLFLSLRLGTYVHFFAFTNNLYYKILTNKVSDKIETKEKLNEKTQCKKVSLKHLAKEAERNKTELKSK